MPWGPPGATPGTCRICGLPARKPNAFYCEEHKPAAKLPAAPPSSTASTEGGESAGDENPYQAGETRPGKPVSEEKVSGIFDRIRASHKPKPPKTAERKPKVSFRRQSTAGLFEFVWAQGGQALVMTGKDIPVGRVLALQAPIVGDVLDDAIKGTILDKVLQPFVRQGERAKLVGAVVLPPVLVATLERNPQAAPTIMPILRAAMIPMLVEMAKASKKAKADEKKLLEAMDEIADQLPPELLAEAREKGLHPVDALLGMIFAPPTPASPEGKHVKQEEGIGGTTH